MLHYIALAPVLFFVTFRTWRLIRNYLIARKVDLPMILLPVSFEDAWWIPLRPLFAWVERLPLGLGNWYLFTDMGWPTADGNKTVVRLGENFVLVSPSSNQLVSCYPAGIQHVFRDPRRFIAPESQSQLFAVYGQNVSSTNGADWQRHRKITALAFTEKTFHHVWAEAIKRTKDIDFINPIRTLSGIRSTFDVLAMHVLVSVGFGQDTSLTAVPPGHRESLMESLGFILRHIILTIIFSGLKAPDFLLPNALKRLKVAVADFRLYMEEAVLRHMQQQTSTKARTGTTSLLEAMVNANEAEKQQLQSHTGRPSYLTESELYGNLFVFNLAGYETTASSFTFALSYLATNPDKQKWVTEEIDAHYRAANSRPYDEIYPKLVRCQALMYETLRLASPAPLIVREPTSPLDVPIITSEGERMITVDRGTVIGCHFYGSHLSPRWGADAATFNPARFVSASSSGAEKLVVPSEVLYVPWGSGPRNCPAKKFSQVEFVAVIAQLLSEYRVEPLKLETETVEMARQRLEGVLDEKYFNISAHLKRPGDAGVKFVKR